MAARVFLQRRSLATLALGGMALAPTAVFAEAPIEPKRKPIYDFNDIRSSNPAPVAPSKPVPSKPVEEEQPEQKESHGPTPTDRLAAQVSKVRLALYKYAVRAENKVNDTMDSAFNLEQSFTSTIASLAPPRDSGEQLLPGTIYVLVAAMAGSIITRNRNILLRASMPLALGIGAGWMVIPITMRNISDLTWKYEERFPVLAQAHIRTRENIQRGIRFAKVHSELGVRYVDEKVTDARESVEGWVQKGK